MRYRILEGELKSSTKFKEKIGEYINRLIADNRDTIVFNFDELSEILLSACRMNDLNILSRLGNKKFLNEDVAERWIIERLLPNTVVMDFSDEDVIRLLIFCFEITYQMFEGGTKATVSAKGFRERRRTFESIVVDQFTGKLGEIMLKRFLENKFSAKIELDWEISRQIEKYRNDIINARKWVCIKTSPSLAGIWAEADIGYDYGITVKCSVPEPTILQFFVEVCGFSRLLNFAESKIPSSDDTFKGYIDGMRERIKDYKCGELLSKLKGFICGYFKTSDYKPLELGEKLAYLGEVREKRYLLQIREIKYTNEDWLNFLKKIGLK
ncbi:MAG: hypothetical protein QMC83_04655 [Thermodesulfovibrionales bacterium]|nr:hypothetical protein [Thermodesulfovibrionales bacterium]